MNGSSSEALDFMEWFCGLPYAHKIFVAGNHDEVGQKVLIDLEVALFLYLLTFERRLFFALSKMRPVHQEPFHSLWSRLFRGPLKMRSV